MNGYAIIDASILNGSMSSHRFHIYLKLTFTSRILHLEEIQNVGKTSVDYSFMGKGMKKPMRQDFIEIDKAKKVFVKIIVCVCVCVCEREREREIIRGTSQWCAARYKPHKSEWGVCACVKLSSFPHFPMQILNTSNILQNVKSKITSSLSIKK